MKKIIPFILLALIGCFNPRGVKKDYTTIIISGQDWAHLKADTMLVYPESKEVVLLGDAWVVSEGVTIHSDSISFFAEENKTSGQALSINLYVHPKKIEGDGKTDLSGYWSADSASYFTKTRELALRGNVQMYLGEMNIESDAVNLYMKR